MARRHRNNAVLALLLINIFHLQQHFVLLDTELGLFAYGEQNGMFFVPGADALDHSFALQEVFLAQQGVGLLVSRVSAYQFPDNALAAVFVHAALR